jgi:hypothetical protein
MEFWPIRVTVLKVLLIRMNLQSSGEEWRRGKDLRRESSWRVSGKTESLKFGAAKDVQWPYFTRMMRDLSKRGNLLKVR